MENKRSRVFIVDDYAPMRQSLRKLLDMEPDFEVCGEAADVDQACQGILAAKPDVAIVDLVLGPDNGLDLLARLSEKSLPLPILILTMLPEALNVETVLNHQARGYIMKSESPDQILVALREVVKGNLYLSPEMAQKLSAKGYFRHD